MSILTLPANQGVLVLDQAPLLHLSVSPLPLLLHLLPPLDVLLYDVMRRRTASGWRDWRPEASCSTSIWARCCSTPGDAGARSSFKYESITVEPLQTKWRCEREGYCKSCISKVHLRDLSYRDSVLLCFVFIENFKK